LSIKKARRAASPAHSYKISGSSSFNCHLSILLGILHIFLVEMCSNSAKAFQAVTWRVCPMRKPSSLAVLFLLAALLCTGSAAFAFDKNHLMKFEAKKSCRECDLSGANLSGASMSNANLKNANLKSADLRKANLQKANLQEANLVQTDLRNADLRNADLRNAQLFRTNLRGADLTGANIEGAEMIGAKFCKTKMPWGIDNDDC